MISPFLYHAWAVLRADLTEDAKLNAEINAIFESFEFYKEKALPPAMMGRPAAPRRHHQGPGPPEVAENRDPAHGERPQGLQARPQDDPGRRRGHGT